MAEVSAEGGESGQAMTKRELEELLGPRFAVESFRTWRLTQPGDNYISNMQALEVELTSQSDKLSLVAKLPPTTPFLQEMSQFGKLLKKEAQMYLHVAKVIQDIQLENNVPVGQIVDFLPKCYGAHVSYVDDEPVADKSVLLLENLGTRGYRCADRIAGLDFDHTDLVVSRLARFHATAVAVKIKKPLVFKNAILPACEAVQSQRPSEEKGKMEEKILGDLGKIDEIQTYMDRLKKCLVKKPDFSLKGPFASIKHNDLWTNNVMFKYSPDSMPTDVKFVDFQMTMYDSPARDLIFFLYSSSEVGLVPEHFAHFVQLYHEQFVDQLAKLGCDTGPFSREALNQEINRAAPEELAHCVMMLGLITKERSDAPDMDEIKSPADLEKMMDSKKSEGYYIKVIEVVTDFANKGWL